ncbi:helix-turn-helix domain-containing protein [Granulosicoccus antarcticus]|uniref:helix-turn-helix domain-containing protein n=1 Tax=Granulosicoccus antarcticus TaxID=437505 RepID=UPI003AAD3813
MSHIANPMSMDSRLATEFGMALKAQRKAVGLSQDALAFSSGLDRTYISLLERGKRQPSLSTLYSVSNALGIKPWKLIMDMSSAK